MFLSILLRILTTKITVLILGFLSMILMVKGLGVDGRGVLAALMVYPQLIISLLEGGMRQAGTLFLGKKLALPESVLGSLILYGAIAGALGFLLSVVLVTLTSSFDFGYQEILAVSFIIPIQLFVAYLKGFFLGFENYSHVNKILYVPKVMVFVGLIVLFIMEEMTVASVVLITLIGNLINLLQSLFYLKFLELGRPSFEWPEVYRLFKKGIPYAIALFLIVSNYKIDVLLLGELSSAAQLGNYAVAVQFGELLWQLPAALVLMLMAKSASANDRKNFSRNVATISRISLFTTLLFACFLYLVIPLVVKFLLGEGLESVVSIYLLLLPGLIMMVVFKVVNSDLAGEGNPFYSIYVMSPAVLINVVINIWLIPIMGAEGAAIASSISYAFSMLGIIFIHSRKYKYKLQEYLIITPGDFVFLMDKVIRILK